MPHPIFAILKSPKLSMLAHLRPPPPHPGLAGHSTENPGSASPRVIGLRENLCPFQTNPKLQIVLGDGGHRGTGYVTLASAVQLVSQICKLFWPNELELTNQFDKVSTFFWKSRFYRVWLVTSRSLGQIICKFRNKLNSWCWCYITRTAVTTIAKYDDIFLENYIK